MAPLNGSIPSCGEGALACSCGDCPSGPACAPPPAPPPPEPPGCPAVGTTLLTCTDLWLAVLYLGLLACLPLVVHRSRQQLEEGELRRSQEAEGSGSAAAAAGSGGRRQSRHGSGSTEGMEGAAGPGAGSADEHGDAQRDGAANGKAGTGAAAAGAAQRGEIEEEGSAQEEEEKDLVEWPAAEQLLRRWFFRLGRGCAARPWRVLAASLLLVGACAAGLTRFRWVHPAKASAGRQGREGEG